ncbi:hypothetical protein LL240_09045 [Oceanimonas baumannii]|uniref:hypothetical protein n=1 Tax=Oceanimonas baumannii TaxID=129578 RepID=UPI001D1988C8|nr:hypothetical protein [Oceanimonas baumannii]MCC4264604.1 hypothetical protein [Oceanimonas baumannii]
MNPIKQRQVFYLHGFDPRGASHYHRLYREQAKQQSSVNGLHIEVSARKRQDEHSHHWQLDASGTRSCYCFLSWDDIVRRHWTKGWGHILSDILCFMRNYVLTPNLLRYITAAPKQLMAGLYPAVFMLLSLILSLWLSTTVAAQLPWQAAQWPAGLVLFAALMHGSKLAGNKLAVFWLLRIYAFSARWANGKVPELEPRINHFARQIASAINDDNNDEIVIIAHSVGTMMVIPTLAQALEQVEDKNKLNNQRVVLITLGHCIPLISFHPQAIRFKAAIRSLAHTPQLMWLDYTAPTDGACFPLLNPVTSCGEQCAPNAGPQMLSPRFFTLYHPARYKKLRRAWYTMHFLYLMATDKPGPYDFFAFTAGPGAIASQLKERT